MIAQDQKPKPDIGHAGNGKIMSRTYTQQITPEELVWHTDGCTRFMKVLEGVGWKFQFNNEPAREIGPGTSIHINKHALHRMIKGATPLTVRIVEL